ncbi:hypothetical protein JHK86_006998 [Glycine max]|nr:hypothetical protein JHK86_006998 [Glycine max]
MALQFLKHPLTISRGLQNETTLTFLSRLRNPKLPLSVRCEDNVQIPTSFRSYATAKSEKVLQVKKKKRLDEICVEKYQQYSRSIIQSWILQGKVYVDGKVINKAGTPVPDKAVVEIIADIPKYVCRAGHKLEAAIEQLGVDVTGKVALDSGLSTGGFTDCLLQYGASHVYGVDVGYGQVADKIRRDERVSVIERTNLRYLAELPQNVDLVTLDLSFISILLVMPAVVNVMKENAALVTLVKPQFEARRSQCPAWGHVQRCFELAAHMDGMAVFGNGDRKVARKRRSTIVRSLDYGSAKKRQNKAKHSEIGLPEEDASGRLGTPAKRQCSGGKGGIVKDPAVHQEVLEKIVKGVEKFGFCCKGWIESPLKGAEGNIEFLVHFNRTHNTRVPEDLE